MSDTPAHEVPPTGRELTPEELSSPATTQETLYNAPFAVSISFPESVVIKMVDATALNDYEVGLFFSSLFASIFAGFIVAYLQDANRPNMLLVIALVFVVSAGVFFAWAMAKRHRMKARSRTFKLKTSSVEEIKD